MSRNLHVRSMSLVQSYSKLFVYSRANFMQWQVDLKALQYQHWDSPTNQFMMWKRKKKRWKTRVNQTYMLKTSSVQLTLPVTSLFFIFQFIRELLIDLHDLFRFLDSCT